MLNKNLLIIGDTHFKKYDCEFDVPPKYYNKNTYLVLLGDILHTHDKIDMFCLKSAISFIEEMSLHFLKVIIIIGNHDRPNNKVFCEKDVHPFNGLSHNKKVIIVDVPIIFDEMLFVPYVEDGRFMECLEKYDMIKTIEDKSIKVVFAHQNFKNAKFNELIVSDCTEEYPLHFPLCISGHIHVEQTVQSNLKYCGYRCLYSLNKKNLEIKCIEKYKEKTSHSSKSKPKSIGEYYDKISQTKIDFQTFEDILKSKIEESKYSKEYQSILNDFTKSF